MKDSEPEIIGIINSTKGITEEDCRNLYEYLRDFPGASPQLALDTSLRFITQIDTKKESLLPDKK